MAVNIVCCVKQVPDPETPSSAFRVDETAKRVIPAPGIAPVISQFDQIAVEAALRVKDAAGEGKITVLSLGPDSARDVIKTGLAMGADDGVHLNDPALFDGDSYSAAVALVAACSSMLSMSLPPAEARDRPSRYCSGGGNAVKAIDRGCWWSMAVSSREGPLRRRGGGWPHPSPAGPRIPGPAPPAPGAPQARSRTPPTRARGTRARGAGRRPQATAMMTGASTDHDTDALSSL